MAVSNAGASGDPGRRRKSDRLEARITREQKELLQHAATLEGRTLTDFVVESAQAAALRTVREHEVVTLGVRDREIFVAALLEEPAPGERLEAAYRRYRRRVDSR